MKSLHLRFRDRMHIILVNISKPLKLYSGISFFNDSRSLRKFAEAFIV